MRSMRQLPSIGDWDERKLDLDLHAIRYREELNAGE